MPVNFKIFVIKFTHGLPALNQIADVSDPAGAGEGGAYTLL